MNEGKINSLEMDGADKQAKIDKFQRIFMNFTAENKRLKEENSGVTSSIDLKSKVKKLSEEVREKNKKVEDGDKKMSEVMKKFSEETNIRAKAEAEVVRAHKMIDYLQEMLEEKRAVSDKAAKQNEVRASENPRDRVLGKQRCLDQDKPEGCTFGSICRFSHDQGKEELQIVKYEDCTFWLEGSCRFTDQACRFIHDPRKKGSKPPRQDSRRASGVTNGSFLGPSMAGTQGSASSNQAYQPGQHAVGAVHLVAAGDQVYLQQAGQAAHQGQGQQQVIQQVQPGQMLQQMQPS